MRGFVAVARREIAENRMALLAAIIAGMSPIAVPIVRNFHGAHASEERSLVVFFAAVTLAAGLSIVLGFSTLSQGISNRRIGFFFDRPLSSLTIWAGKLTGVAALALAAAMIATLPTLLVNGGNLQMPFGWSLWLFLALALLLIPVSHALSVLIRSRSALIGADFLVFGLAALVVALAARPLVRAHAVIALRWGLIGVAVIVWLGFLTAGYRAVARGRTDIRAAHRALSPVLWLFAAVGVIGFAAYTRFLLSAGPEDLTDQWGETMAKGSWVVVGGAARHRFDYQPRFAYNIESRQSRRLPDVSTDTRLFFSHEAKTLLWFEGAEPPYELVTLTLGRQVASSEVRHTRIFSASRWSQVALSADDRWLALAEPKGKEPGLLSVYELGSGRFLASTPLSPLTHIRLFFPRTDLLRVYEIAEVPGSYPVRIRIFDFDWAARKATAGGEIGPLGTGWLLLSPSPDGNRLLVRDPVKRSFFLADGRSGQTIAALFAPGWKARFAMFLSDGRIALAETNETQARLRILDDHGPGTPGIGLPYAETIFPAAELSPGKLVVAFRSKAGVSAWTSLLVDLKTGSLKTLGEGLFPLATFSYWNTLDPFAGPAPGSPASRLFSTSDHRLVEVDPATGVRRVILGNG
jgi:hypothetical protein